MVARLRIAVLLVVAVVVQTALAPDLRIGGVVPDVMVVVVICAGLTGGAEAGAWVGFWAGLLIDMFLASTPIGLSALTYCLTGAAIGALRTSVLQERRMLVPVAGLLGTAGAVLLFVVAGDVLGQHQLVASGRSWLIRVDVIESLWSAVLALPVCYLYARIAKGSVGSDRFGSPVGGGSRSRAVPLR